MNPPEVPRAPDSPYDTLRISLKNQDNIHPNMVAMYMDISKVQEASSLTRYAAIFNRYRRLMRDDPANEQAIKDVCDLILLPSETVIGLWSFLVEMDKFFSLRQLRSILLSVPPGLTPNKAKSYWTAMRAATQKDGFINLTKKYRTNLARSHMTHVVEEANYRFEITTVRGKKTQKGKETKPKKILALVCPQVQQLVANYVDDEAAEAGPEEDVEDDVEISMPGQKYYGVLIRETMFSGGVVNRIHNMFDRHFEFLELQREHGAEDIFIGADVPYFATKNYWDDPEFVGTSVRDFPRYFVKVLSNIMANRNGMAIIFGNVNYQLHEMKKELLKLKEKRLGGVTEIVDVVVHRANYKSRTALQPRRNALVNNVEMCLQVIFGKPIIDYSSSLFKNRENLISIPWDRRIKGTDGEVVNTAQKPVALWTEFLKSIKCDLVLDLFAGTGSLSVAAAQRNLPFVAVEKDDKMCKEYHRRLKAIVTTTRDTTIRFFMSSQTIVGTYDLTGTRLQPVAIVEEEELEEVPGYLTADIVTIDTLSPKKDVPVVMPPGRKQYLEGYVASGPESEEGSEEGSEEEEEEEEEEDHSGSGEDDIQPVVASSSSSVPRALKRSIEVGPSDIESTESESESEDLPPGLPVPVRTLRTEVEEPAAEPVVGPASESTVAEPETPTPYISQLHGKQAIKRVHKTSVSARKRKKPEQGSTSTAIVEATKPQPEKELRQSPRNVGKKLKGMPKMK